LCSFHVPPENLALLVRTEFAMQSSFANFFCFKSPAMAYSYSSIAWTSVVGSKPSSVNPQDWTASFSVLTAANPVEPGQKMRNSKAMPLKRSTAAEVRRATPWRIEECDNKQ
jgi:hypothetical protein